MEKETLKYVLAYNTTRALPSATPRALQLPLDVRKVITLVGIRRSGKTYVLYETMRRLEAQGVDRRRIIYLNFEDDRLLPIRTRELDLILRAHDELYPDFAREKKYLFFDEVRGAPGWEAFIRRVDDTEDVRIFLTGSSSHLLSREIATGLRGRSISYEVFPLSFAEFLQPASLLNVHKLYNDFRSQGLPLSKDTLYHYVACLEESYLIFPVPIADRSVRKRAMNPKKLHAIDWALGYPFLPETRIDTGKKLETAVFLHWRRQREDLGYLGGEREIDLVVGTDRPEALINVALSLTAQATWEREIGTLTRAGTRRPGARRFLVAH